MKSKSTAAFLAIFLGGFGGHKFYLGETGTGILYLVLCPTMIPFVLGFFQGLNLLGMSQAAFDARYNGRSLAVVGFPGIQQQSTNVVQQSTNVVVNVAPPHGYGPPPGAAQHAYMPASTPALPSGDVAARISALHNLKVAGALTEAEFNAEKQKLLMASHGS